MASAAERIVRIVGVVAVAVLTALAAALAGDIDVGREAIKRGDFDAAREALAPLAAQDDPEAQLLIGVVILSTSTPPDYGAAAIWFRRAADQGLADAQSQLGAQYFGGLGVPQSFETAAEWWHKAAAQGQANAQAGLGALYGLGFGVVRDEVEAYFWLTLAWRGGVADALARRDDEVAPFMSDAQIAAAEQRLREHRAD